MEITQKRTSEVNDAVANEPILKEARNDFTLKLKIARVVDKQYKGIMFAEWTMNMNRK
jgi:hypothetical protein